MPPPPPPTAGCFLAIRSNRKLYLFFTSLRAMPNVTESQDIEGFTCTWGYWLFLLEHKLELMFSSIDPCTSPIVQLFSPLIDFALALIYMHVIQPPIAGDQSAPSVHVQLARQPISVCYRFACGYALVHFLSEIFILHFGLQSLSRFSPPTHRRSFKKGYPLGFYKECMFPKR